MKSFKITTIILTIIATISFVSSVSAQTSKSEWVETGIVVEVPHDYPIQSGLTKNNTPKYWLDIEGCKINVSPTNYTKFINKEIGLIVVEWHNSTKGTYRYTTRQKPITNKPSRLNLKKL